MSYIRTASRKSISSSIDACQYHDRCVNVTKEGKIEVCNVATSHSYKAVGVQICFMSSNTSGNSQEIRMLQHCALPQRWRVHTVAKQLQATQFLFGILNYLQLTTLTISPSSLGSSHNPDPKDSHLW